MCGIAGFFQARPLDERAHGELERMVARLKHRGPDGQSQHVDLGRGLAMGHTRLSVIDLTRSGTQPIVDRERSLVLTVNGEFYDYKTARATLSARGERFETKTDSEIALKLYRRHGLQFVDDLRGEFAFALYDGQADRLILVRDRFGVRPLFYHLRADALYYASEAKALLSHPSVPKRLDHKSALNQMMHTLVPGTSAFEGIGALLPGHFMVVERRGGRMHVTTRKYWDADFLQAAEHDPSPDPDHYVARARDELIDAVRVRLEADVPVGCYLSGGIDSCSILGLSTSMQQSAVKAFTIAFDDDAYDESVVATKMAFRVKADQEVLRLTAPDLYGDSYIRTLWHAERTFYNTLGVAKWHMSKRVRECGFKVVVTGEGADELFAGYPFFKRDYFVHAPDESSRRHQQAMDAKNALFEGAILSEEPVSHPAFEDLCGFTPSWLQPWILTLSRVRPLFSDATLEALGDYDPVAAIAEKLDPSQVRGRHVLDIAQYTWMKTMLECQILNWGGDRVDMANSMESRPPFLDHHLAEFAKTIPPSLRIRNGVEKWVLREAMKGVLPELLYKREKFAFMAPPSHTDPTKRLAVKEMVDARMGPEQIGQAGLFDPGRVQRFVDRYFRGDQDPVLAKRDDIILNHLLGLHIIHQDLVLAA